MSSLSSDFGTSYFKTFSYICIFCCRNIAEEGDCGRVCTPLNNLTEGSRKLSILRKSSVADTIWEGESDREAMANGDLGASKDVMRSSEQKIGGRERLVSTSLTQTPVVDSALQDFHQHRLMPGVDPFDLKYRLYAVVVSTSLVTFIIFLFWVTSAHCPFLVSVSFWNSWWWSLCVLCL